MSSLFTILVLKITTLPLLSIEFMAGDTSQFAQWTPVDSEQYIVLSMRLQTQQAFTENNNHAQDATEYYSFKKVENIVSGSSMSQC